MRTNILLLLVLAALWGPSFLFIKISVEEISPMLLAGLRIGLAAIVLNLFLYLKSQRLTWNIKFWKQVTISGLFAQAIPFTLINWGEQYVDSGLASILNGLTPLSTVIMAHYFISTEQLTTKKIIGVILGFFGLAVLCLPQLIDGANFGLLGIAAVALGAISYGVGMIFSRIYFKDTPPMHAPAGQLLVTSMYMLPISIYFDTSTKLLSLSTNVVLSVLVLGIFGTAVAFVVYFKLLKRAGPSFLSLVTYIMPVFSVVLGIIFLNETLSITVLWGMGLILLGIFIVNIKTERLFKSIPKRIIYSPAECAE